VTSAAELATSPLLGEDSSISASHPARSREPAKGAEGPRPQVPRFGASCLVVLLLSASVQSRIQSRSRSP
jgi:hypothetical protein